MTTRREAACCGAGSSSGDAGANTATTITIATTPSVLKHMQPLLDHAARDFLAGHKGAVFGQINERRLVIATGTVQALLTALRTLPEQTVVLGIVCRPLCDLIDEEEPCHA